MVSKSGESCTFYSRPRIKCVSKVGDGIQYVIMHNELYTSFTQAVFNIKPASISHLIWYTLHPNVITWISPYPTLMHMREAMNATGCFIMLMGIQSGMQSQSRRQPHSGPEIEQQQHLHEGGKVQGIRNHGNQNISRSWFP